MELTPKAEVLMELKDLADKVIAHPQRIGDNGQRRIESAAAWEKACVDDIQIIDLVCPAVQVEDGTGGVRPESQGPILVAHPADIKVIPFPLDVPEAVVDGSDLGK